MARTGGAGVGLFALPIDAPGLSVKPMRSMDLLRPLSSLSFDRVAVGSDALLGVAEAAWPNIDWVRVMICTELVGGAEKCLEDSVACAKERVARLLDL
ncbi:MAG: hypothetical protein QF890_13925 [Myxococcota bacterium]|nr:hypothetical protein [Deltaproteobacteria bacterium]MCP4243688.1 hypothetical protein [bacterium]MDP6073840.1 hypothetical protein [Myxococcota bacterium]MDP6243867.1 hypothetical protein [Myxococcota bacterium]MDP7073605.1 hypothetical protein [Myxococcota bacterium]